MPANMHLCVVSVIFVEGLNQITLKKEKKNQKTRAKFTRDFEN